MNANELADELDWHWDNDCRSPAISKAATMLRQQQAEIERLTQENCDLWEQLNDGKAGEK